MAEHLSIKMLPWYQVRREDHSAKGNAVQTKWLYSFCCCPTSTFSPVSLSKLPEPQSNGSIILPLLRWRHLIIHSLHVLCHFCNNLAQLGLVNHANQLMPKSFIGMGNTFCFFFLGSFKFFRGWRNGAVNSEHLLLNHEDKSSNPKMHVRQLTDACNSNFEGPDTLFSTLRAPPHTVHTCSHTHTHNEII